MLMLKKGFYYFMKEESLEFESKLDKNGKRQIKPI